jgi:hypothetical protein
MEEMFEALKHRVAKRAQFGPEAGLDGGFSASGYDMDDLDIQLPKSCVI